MPVVTRMLVTLPTYSQRHEQTEHDETRKQRYRVLLSASHLQCWSWAQQMHGKVTSMQQLHLQGWQAV